MFGLIFALFWTALTLFMAIRFVPDADGLERVVLLAFPAVGAILVWHQWRVWRRWSSVREVHETGGTVYVWTDLDGRPCRSDRDPRPDWEAADGDGDGGGGD